jgi:hypothetical protein
MSIFKDFFHKVFGAGADDIGTIDPQKRWEENLGDESENPEKKESTITDRRKLYQLLDKDIFKSSVEEFYEVYKSVKDINDYLKQADELVEQIIESALPKDYVEDFGPGIKSEVMSLIIKIIKNYEALDKDNRTEEQLSKLINLSLSNAESDLYRLLELLDEFLNQYQEDPQETVPFIQSKLNLDQKEFFNDIIPIVILFRKFQITAYSDITDDMKKEFLEKVNAFSEKYSKTWDLLLSYLSEFITTQRNRGASHPSVIGAR